MVGEKFWLTFSWGWINWFAYLGVIKYLEESNLKPSIIWWTSIWAILWVLIAAWYTYSDLEKEVFELEKRIKKIKDFNWKRLTKSFFTWNLKHSQGLILWNKIKLEIENLLRRKWIYKFSDLKIPFYLQMVNLNTWENLCVCSLDPEFKEKDPVEYVRASFSMPWLFTPYEIDWEHYFDWGVKANSPILSFPVLNERFSLWSKELLALNVKKDFSKDDSYEKQHFINIWFRSISMLVDQQYDFSKKEFLFEYPSYTLKELNIWELYKDSIMDWKVSEIIEYWYANVPWVL